MGNSYATVTITLTVAGFRVLPNDQILVFLRKDWRRRPDLNRGWRFCRPLPYHLATAPLRTVSGDPVNTASYQTPGVRSRIRRSNAAAQSRADSGRSVERA